MDTFSVWHWLILLGIPSIAVIAILWSSRRNRNGVQEPAGIGGWLLLLALGLVVSPFRTIADTLQNWQDYKLFLTEPNGPLLAYGETGINLAICALQVVVAILFFNKSRRFPRLFVCLWLAYPVALVVDALLAAQVLGISIQDTLSEDIITVAIAGFVISGVWVLYVTRSVRARNTFVR